MASESSVPCHHLVYQVLYNGRVRCIVDAWQLMHGICGSWAYAVLHRLPAYQHML